MEHQECKFEDKIIQMAETIQRIDTTLIWMKEDCVRRNGILETHVAGSAKVRDRVTRNVTWRHAYKVCICAIFIILGFMAKFLISQHLN